jgi:hypothetical protein
MNVIVVALALLLSGCSTTGVMNPKQVEGNATEQPLCLFWCNVVKTITVQEGAKVTSDSGSVSIAKPLNPSVTFTETVTDSTTTTESQK